MPFRIVRNDITKMQTDAIVNTANSEVTVGEGCDYAVYTAAGFTELLSYRSEKIGCREEGTSFVTPGFRLPVKCIIHTVSPQYRNGASVEEKLRNCYRSSLAIAWEQKLKSVAFPLIASGSFAYPKEEALRIAIDEISAFLLNNEMDVFLVVYDEQSSALGYRIDSDLKAYIDNHYVEEAATSAKRRNGLFQSAIGHFRQEKSNAMATYTMESAACVERPKKEKKASSKPTLMPIADMNEEVCDAEYVDLAENCTYESIASEEAFDEKHESKLAERMKHLSDTYSEYLLYLIQDKGMENAEVWKRAIVDKKIFSKIKNNRTYHPNKLTALCLCVGAKLNLDETRDLLARAGYALSPCDKTDIIFSYFIENNIYDMIELDIQLEEHGLPCIIE